MTTQIQLTQDPLVIEDKIRPISERIFGDKNLSAWGKWFLVLVMLGNVYDLSGDIGLKYWSLGLVSIYAFFRLKTFKSNFKDILTILFIFLIGPSWALLLGIATGGELDIAIAQFTPLLSGVVFFVMLYDMDNRYAMRTAYWMLLSLAILAIIVNIIFFYSPGNATLFKVLRFCRFTYDEFSGPRPLYQNFVPRLYLRPALFFAPAMVYFFFRSKVFLALILLAALSVSASKGGAIVGLMFCAIYIIRHLSEVKLNLLLLLSVLLVIIGLYSLIFLLPGFFRDIGRVLGGSSETVHVRIGHLKSIFNLFAENPLYFIFGQGLGHSFYTMALDDYVFAIEVGHVDAIRRYGLIWVLAYFAFWFKIGADLMRSNDRELKAIGTSLFCLFIVGATNAVIINPLCSIMLIACFYICKQEVKNGTVGNLDYSGKLI